MLGNLNKYFDEINTNSKKISITDSKGNNLNEDKAYQMIYKQLYQMQKECGVLHFIGNGASASIASHFGLDYFKAEDKNNTFNDLSH